MSDQDPSSMPDTSSMSDLIGPQADSFVSGIPDAPTTDISAPPQSTPQLQPTPPDTGYQSPDASVEVPGPQKPSLWKTVLTGALQGLAAGGAVNSRGMGKAGASAAGAAAGANQVINVQPQQQAA